MCELCVQHGEGQKWYQNTKNYVMELLNEERKKILTDLFQSPEERVASGLAGMDKAIGNDPAAKAAVLKQSLERLRQEPEKVEWGQVIPIEDVEEILDRTVSITRVPCICRSNIYGIYDSRFCYALATFKSDFWPTGCFDQFPDFSKNLEVLTREEAKEEHRNLDREGVVHCVYSHGIPYISFFCNCTPKDCVALRMRLHGASANPFKGEYVATIDPEMCTGCRDCMKICNFGAIYYSAALQRCFVDQQNCFGCGLCRTACPTGAVTLQDRNAIPMLAREW